MIIHQREERSNALWRFAGIACIPILLCFFAGFSVGNTSATERRNYQVLYKAELDKANRLQEKSSRYEQFFSKGDSIVSSVGDKLEELDKQLREAVTLKDNNAVLNWDDDVRKFFRTMNRSLDDLELDYLKDNPDDPVLKNGLKYFREYKRLNEARLQQRRELMGDTFETAQLDALAEREKEIDAKSKKLEEESKEQSSEKEKSKLEKKLEECEAELNQLRKNSDKNNEKPVAAIKGEVDKIRAEILPNMAAKWIGNDKDKINRLKEMLRTNLDKIYETTKEIK